MTIRFPSASSSSSSSNFFVFWQKKMKSCSSERIGVRQYNKSELPRLRWTPELHRYFVQTVEILGGRNQATPKRILQMMGVKGLKISHIKSHLQMYRSMKVEHGSRCEHVMMRQALTKQARRRTFQSSYIKMSSVSSSSGTLREEEEFNGSNRKHESSSNIKDRIISQQEDDSDSSLQSRIMSEEECNGIDGTILEEQTCELSLSLKPMTQQILETQLQLCPNNTNSISNSTSTSQPHHHINLDLTM